MASRKVKEKVFSSEENFSKRDEVNVRTFAYLLISLVSVEIRKLVVLFDCGGSYLEVLV